MKKYTNEEEIRLTAYYMWEESGRPWGQENEFWQKACDKLMNSKSTCKTTKCSSKKVAATKVTAKTNTTKSTAKTASKTKAKTNLKVSAAHTTIKSNAAINNAYGFKSNISSLKSKVSLNSNINSNTNFNTKNGKKSLI